MQQIYKQVIRSDVFSIASDLRSIYNWSLTDNELERMIDDAMPYIIRAVMLNQDVPNPETIRKVFINYYKYNKIVSILLYSCDEADRNCVSRICENWIRITIQKNFAWLVASGYRDMQDVINDCWIDILKNLTKYGYRSSLKTWIIAITINRCNHIAKDIQKTRKKVIMDDTLINNITIKIDPINALELKSRSEKLYEYIKQICEKMNKSKDTDLKTRIGIGRDKFTHGMSNKDIAKKYNVNENTVSSIIKRIKDRLPEKIE